MSRRRARDRDRSESAARRAFMTSRKRRRQPEASHPKSQGESPCGWMGFQGSGGRGEKGGLAGGRRAPRPHVDACPPRAMTTYKTPSREVGYHLAHAHLRPGCLQAGTRFATGRRDAMRTCRRRVRPGGTARAGAGRSQACRRASQPSMLGKN